MRVQIITLLAYFPQTGAAQLPVGVIARDPDTDNWRHYLLQAPEAVSWEPLIAFARSSGRLLSELLQTWMEQANGVTLDLEVQEVQADSLDAALDKASLEVLADYAVMVEEV